MMNHWMFNCKEVTRVVSESMDRTLPIHQRIFIRIHLLMCKYCSRFRSQLLLIRNLIRSEKMRAGDSDDTIVLPPDACGRIKRSLQKSSENLKE
ncbi:MAG: zf-HC2 domain-containing protein [Deltaproteobacteria bacterium]|nr:MAG: zf-HC2 domain-containing protein [Deltaproteobacteria bacterium]